MGKPKIFEELERLASLVPVAFYWTDINSVIVGVNQYGLTIVGNLSYQDIVGKSPYDMYPIETAIPIEENIKAVIQAGKVLSFEESVADLTTGKTRYYTAVRAPLFDNGKVVGTVGATIDITAEKEAERLKLENEHQKAKITDHEEFKKIVGQVVHDIRSPLTSLSMMLHVYEAEIPEEARLTLRNAVSNVSDIASSMLNRYKRETPVVTGKVEPSNTSENHSSESACLPEEKKRAAKEGASITTATEQNAALDELDTDGLDDQPQPTMVLLLLSQVLSDKKYQYQEQAIKFTSSFCSGSSFTFLNIAPLAFRRMMSNLINNAVEAFNGKREATIHLALEIEPENVKITVQDNGKGMPQEMIDKILNNSPITTDKKEGHGIGLAQIRETIRRNNGKLAIESKVGFGTKMILTFPKIFPPGWIACEIKLNKGDTVIILDDDSSIHGAWDACLGARAEDHINLKHFTSGAEAVDFINAFPEKDKLFLLTDFELLKQDLNGIDVIEKTHLKRAILVTSHHAEEPVHSLAVKNNIKILPKQLAPEVLIEVCEDDKNCAKIGVIPKIDIVVIDDNQLLANSTALFFESKNKKVDKYYTPQSFLKKLSRYSKSTIICMDNDFKSTITGFDLARELHAKGFTRLYIFSGKEFEAGAVPDYLTTVMKGDLEALSRLAEVDISSSKIREKL